MISQHEAFTMDRGVINLQITAEENRRGRLGRQASVIVANVRSVDRTYRIEVTGKGVNSYYFIFGPGHQFNVQEAPYISVSDGPWFVGETQISEVAEFVVKSNRSSPYLLQWGVAATQGQQPPTQITTFASLDIEFLITQLAP